MLRCTRSIAVLAAAIAAPALGAAAVAPDTAPGVLPMSDGAWCVKALSKDFCAPIQVGGVRYGECYDEEGNLCRSIWLQGFNWTGAVKSHQGLCTHTCNGFTCTARCDEVKDGHLSLTFDAIIRDRGTACCNYFGCWSGTWEYVTQDGRFFTGTANGTIGRGSNRGTVCDLDDADACETCHEVVFRNDGFWIIAIEGSFFGADELGRALCFTIDGDWAVPGTCQAGPVFDAAEVFTAEAALEGARLDPCFQ